MRPLFIEELEEVRGGDHKNGHPRPPGKCPKGITTLACGEENGCVRC